MKVVEFPKKADEHQSALEFLDDVRERVEQHQSTSLVVLMMNDDGELGMSVFADYLEAVAMLTLAVREV